MVFALGFVRMAAMDFEPLKAEQKDDPWVTLLRCFALVDADLIATQLRAAEIPVFMPDEFLMQAISFNVATYGLIRVQVPPAKYEEARQLLMATPVAEDEQSQSTV